MINQDKSQLFTVIKKVGLSIGDQGLYSASNFLLNILLVRWLPIESYGFFALSFSLFLFFSSFHNSLILEPISVLATGNHKNHLWSYLEIETKLNFIVLIAISFICILFAGFVSVFSERLAVSFLLTGLSSPFLLGYWFYRRLCYIESQPNIAIVGSTIYSIILLSGVFGFREMDLLDVYSAFGLMSFSSVIASIVVWGVISKKKNEFEKIEKLFFKDIIVEQWAYSKWVVGVSMLYWVNTSIAVPAMGFFTGFSGSGILRGLQNTVLPLQQLGAALGNLFIPWFSSIDNVDIKRIRNKSYQTIFGFAFLGILYILPILFFPEAIIHIFYPKSELFSLVLEIRVISITGFVMILNAVISFILQGRKKPEGVFWANMYGSISAIFVSIPLVYFWGLRGAVLGSLITSIVILIVQIRKFLVFLQFKKQILKETINN